MIVCAARAWLLATRPLWHDELFTAWISRSPLGSLLDSLRRDSGPPLYYVLVHPLAAAADRGGLPDSTIRLLSFAAITALALGARSLPRPAARIGFLALSSASLLLTFYAAEARAYGLLAALAFLLFLLLRRLPVTPARAAGIAILGAAILYTHYLGVFLVGALGLVALIERRFRDAAALAVGAALFAPWIPVLLRQPAAATAWMKDAPIRTTGGFLSALGGVGRLPPAFGLPPPMAVFWIAAVAGAFLLVAVVRASRNDRETRAGVLVVVLVLGTTLAAGIVRPVAFAGRTEMAILPVWLWTVALAASIPSPSGRLVRAGAAAAFTLGAVSLGLTVPAPRYSPSGPRAVAAIEGLARPGDLVVAATGFYLPARLAHDRGTLTAELRGFPREIEKHPGWFPLAPPPAESYADLERILAGRPGGSRAWIAIHPLFSTARLSEILDATGSAREGLRGRDVIVLVWTRGKEESAVIRKEAAA